MQILSFILLSVAVTAQILELATRHRGTAIDMFTRRINKDALCLFVGLGLIITGGIYIKLLGAAIVAISFKMGTDDSAGLKMAREYELRDLATGAVDTRHLHH